MVRPSASPKNRAFGVLFAQSVTVKQDGPLTIHSVGRTGTDSLHALLSVAFPDAVRQNRRRGLSEIEFNKEVERAGFTKIRLRYLNNNCEGIPGSFYRFGGRKWRNPDDPKDLAFLNAAWRQMNENFQSPQVQGCSFEKFTELLRNLIVQPVYKEAIQLSPTQTNSGVSLLPPEPSFARVMMEGTTPTVQEEKQPRSLIEASPKADLTNITNASHWHESAFVITSHSSTDRLVLLRQLVLRQQAQYQRLGEGCQGTRLV
mmetsp:Transcript_49196/g.100451  ORF Transcript_49196/g.100451 Transcript_49196/m.100451 type:complete len:259 (+) Transcript_49196:115-891(+)